MGFLKRDDGSSTPQAARHRSAVDERQRRATRGATVEAPHAGAYRAGSLEGLPESGRERIERMKQDIARGFFTSDLSVNEFLLVKEAGFEPLGLVLGSSIYHIGFQQAMWNQNQEMGVLTQAMYHARELAMTRMEEEADQLGADGIVGVRLDDRPLRVGRRPRRVHRGRHRGQAPRGRAAPGAERPAVHLRPQRPGLLDAAARRLPAGRPRDGQLRLPRRPSGRCGRRLRAGRAQPGDAELHAGALRRPRAGDGADAGGGGASRRPAGSSACGSTRRATAGART